MQFISAVFAAIALAAPAFAAPTAPTHAVQKFQGATTGRYIVKLKDGVAKSAVFGTKKVKLTHDWTLLNGFASDFDAATLESLRTNPNVEYIAEDGIMHITATQNNAPWGLARLSSASKLTNQDTSALTYSYTYDDSAGSGVDIYIIGKSSIQINYSTSQFGGRARWGATFGGYADADGHGHGTHCAGTAAGSQYGVAKAANIIAVKVLSDIGSGSVADIVSGFDWIASSVKSSGRPSIVSMSFGGDVSVPLDNAVASLTAAGIHAVIAAGNDNINADNVSPARVPSAVTVGASTIAGARAFFSNFGSVVDIFAPGVNVVSSWIGSSNTATNTISGTSMATPHVVGLVAYLIGKNGNQTPAEMSDTLQRLSVRDVLSDIPSGTINALAQNIDA